MTNAERELEQWLEEGVPDWFQVNLLPVTKAITDRWGRITIQAKRKGITVATADGLITAIEHELTLVTRNAKDFAGIAVPLFNPWEE